jgi:hypothetical protein
LEEISTYSARYFPSKLTESVETGFRRSLLYPILFQLVMSKTIVKMSLPISSIKIELDLFYDAFLKLLNRLPLTSVQNRKGFFPFLEKQQHSMFSSCKAGQMKKNMVK